MDAKAPKRARPAPAEIVPQTLQQRILKKVSLDYLLYLPRDYRASETRRWPLILFLHGAGERGRNVWKVARHGPFDFARRNPDFPFIIVAPQCLPGLSWDAEQVAAVLDNALAKYAADPARIYLTGLSMGGFAVWDLALRHPRRFAAIAPICGGGTPLALLLQDPSQARALRRIAVWAFHGARDAVVKLEESERMVQAFRQLGGEVRLTVYPDAEHDSWTQTYNNPELYAWFLRHRKRGRSTVS